MTETLRIAQKQVGKTYKVTAPEKSKLDVWRAFADTCVQSTIGERAKMMSVKDVASVVGRLDAQLEKMEKSEIPPGYKLDGYHMLWLKRSLILVHAVRTCCVCQLWVALMMQHKKIPDLPAGGATLKD